MAATPPNQDAARRVAYFRLFMGAGFLSAPGLNTRIWAGGSRDPRFANKLMRAIGARDLVLGAGLLRMLRSPSCDAHELAGWLRASALFDLGDALATLLAAGRVPLKRWLLQLAILGSAAAAGLYAAGAVRSHAPVPAKPPEP